MNRTDTRQSLREPATWREKKWEGEGEEKTKERERDRKIARERHSKKE